MCQTCEQAKAILEEWDGKEGHERCHYYPDLFVRLAQVLGVKLTSTPCLPPRAEFELGCRRYQDEQYGLKGSNEQSHVFPALPDGTQTG